MSALPELNPDDEILNIEVIHPKPVQDVRTQARQAALQALYEIDAAKHAPADVIALHLRAQRPAEKIARYMSRLVTGVTQHQIAIDAALSRYAVEYPLDQIALVDRNVMRIAVYEFAVAELIPVGVAIDEAVELAKGFGAENSPSFVNGVLGAIADDPALLESLKHPTPEEAP